MDAKCRKDVSGTTQRQLEIAKDQPLLIPKVTSGLTGLRNGWVAPLISPEKKGRSGNKFSGPVHVSLRDKIRVCRRA